MDTDIKTRVKRAIGTLGISVTAVAKASGLSDRTMLDQVNGNSKIGVSTLEALLCYRSDISAEWLMRGTGDMLNKSSRISLDYDGEAAAIRETNAALRETIDTQRITINSLIDQINLLKGAPGLSQMRSV